MCTLTYIPVNSTDFFFTTNRDENPERGAFFPQKYYLNNTWVVYPKDKDANGTWMICSERKFSVCLLNGAFEKHKHQPPYQKSRGIMVLELIQFSNIRDFLMDYNFLGIEPFTLVFLSYYNERELEEIRWDGESIHYRNLNPEIPHIWSSSTLYNQEAKEMRVQWFKTWLKEENQYSKTTIINFHKTAGADDLFNGLLMNRNDQFKTVSITQIRKEASEVFMYYEDLSKQSSNEIAL